MIDAVPVFWVESYLINGVVVRADDGVQLKVMAECPRTVTRKGHILKHGA